MVTRAELQLPLDLLRKADRRAKDYAWQRDDVVPVIRAACARGMASLGGEVQFRLPASTGNAGPLPRVAWGGCYELYWLTFGCEDRVAGESWPDYVMRSAEQCIAAFQRLCGANDFVADGLRSYPSLAEAARKQGLDLMLHLYFVLYFRSGDRAEP
jgi:hypothetical protein